MKKFLLSLILLCAFGASAQTVTEATQELPNTFQDTNTFLKGVDLGPVTFVNLPSPAADGKVIYCSNCQQLTPCIGAGTGATAVRTNGVWNCSLGSGGGGGGTSAEFSVNSIDTLSQTVIDFQNGNGVTWSNPSGGHIQASISGVIVNPVASQNIVQPTGTGLNANIFENTRHVDASWKWSQSPAADLSVAGSKTITLTPCPLGIDVSNNTNSPYFVHIATQGTPEEALVTGGSCTSGGTTGTVIVTTVNTHSAGYTVASSTDGVQEAINDAGSPNAYVIVPPCTGSSTCYNIRSTVYLKSNRMTFSAYGAHFSCQTRGACFYIGDRSAAFTNHKFLGGRFAAGVNVDGVQITNTVSSVGTYTVTTSSAHPFVPGDYVFVDWYQANATQHAIAQVASTPSSTTFTYALGSATVVTSAAVGWAALEAAAIEDNGEGTVIRDSEFTSVGSPNKFHFGIVVDNDQAAVIDHISNESSGNVIRCGANFCGPAILGRSDNGAAGIILLKNSDLSMQCGGNGVLDYSGNGLSISDTIIQGTAQFGVYYEAGNQPAKISNVYEEVGTCTNPFYSGGVKANAGIINRGQRMSVSGSLPIVGEIPSFVASSTGSTRRNYYIVPRSGTIGYGPILLAGYCMTSGSGTCTVQWPQIPNNSAGTITYDLLVTDATAAPQTGNAFSVALNQAGTCANSVCSFVDTIAATTAYSIVAQLWSPNLRFWPGTAVIGLNTTNSTNSTGTNASIVADNLQTTAVSGLISGRGVQSISFVLQQCGNFGFASWSPILFSCPQGESYGGVAQLLQQKDPANNTPPTGSRGRLNFGGALTAPIHLITLSDTDPTRTAATPTGRPSADALDMYIGVDQGNKVEANMGLSIGAPLSISQYITNTGDNSSWLTRLTSASYIIKVTTTVNDGTAGARLTGPFGTCAATGDITLDRVCFDAIGDLAFFKKNGTIARKVIPQDYTFSLLPAANSVELGQLAVITDASTTACPVASGGGSNRMLVRSNSSTWDCVGGSGGSGTSISVSLFSALPVSPANNTLAVITDFTGSCPVTSGGGVAGSNRLVRYDTGLTKWVCVPDGNLPFITTLQAWDGAGNGGIHFLPSVTDTNVSDLNSLHMNSLGSLLIFDDSAGAQWAMGMFAAASGLPTAGATKCVSVDSAGHMVFSGGSCLTNPMNTQYDIIVGGALGVPSRLAKGAEGTVLGISGGALTYITPLSNPMTTPNDTIIGGSSGAATRLAGPGAVKSFYGTDASGNIQWNTDPVDKTVANIAGAVFTLDISGSGIANAFRVPVQAGATSGANGAIVYDGTAKITHIRTNGADSMAAATTSTTTTTTQALMATAVAGVYNPRALVAGDLPATIVYNSVTLTGGAGIAAIGDLSASRTIATASGETDFLANGALTCGAATQGRMQVHTTPLQYCDNAATPTLRYAAYGNSSGDALTVVNGITVVGTPSNVTAQSTSQSSVVIATAPGSGFYHLKYYADLNTACTTGGNSVAFLFTWTDATGTRTLQTGSLSMAQGSPAASGYLAGELSIFVGSGNVSYTSTVSGSCASGTSTYDVHSSLTKG